MSLKSVFPVIKRCQIFQSKIHFYIYSLHDYSERIQEKQYSKSKPDYFRLVALQGIMNQISLLTANPISVLLLRTIHYVFREIHD